MAKENIKLGANCMYAKAQMSHTVPPEPSLFAYAIVGMLDEGTGQMAKFAL